MPYIITIALTHIMHYILHIADRRRYTPLNRAPLIPTHRYHLLTHMYHATYDAPHNRERCRVTPCMAPHSPLHSRAGPLHLRYTWASRTFGPR